MVFTHSFQCLVFVAAVIRLASAECRSTGTDFVNNGGPYCVNTTSTDYFSFGTEFQGCVPSDSQGNVVPILIDPDTDEYFCSDIATQPDGVERRSTCNVPGYELRKNQMTSGTWVVIIEGLTFAWMRSFVINAAPPVTVTSTPTLTFPVTSTPIATSTSTSTQVLTTTLPPKTVTVPSTTLTITSTITPKPVTTTSTSILTIPIVQYVFSKTTKTTTITTSCITKPISWDPKATIKPKLAKYAAATGVKATTTSAPKIRARFEKDRAWAHQMRREASALGLFDRRSVDLCTTTILASLNLPSTTITITAPTSTVTVITDATSTSTVTPPPITSYSGKASTTITTTKPTQTITKVVHSVTNQVTTSTVWATVTSTVKVKPSGVVCFGS